MRGLLLPQEGQDLVGFLPFRGVLEDALRAGVVDKGAAADETFDHRHLAPGAQSVGNSFRGAQWRLRLFGLFR